VKRFEFPLERALEWRRTQVQLEQIKLQKLQGELVELASREATIRGELEQAELSIRGSQSSQGVELRALESFRKASAAQLAAVHKSRSELREKLRAQRERIRDKERDVKLLEKLREDRLDAWRIGRDREIDQQAEEAFLARWNR
jgi:hypothetical protein